MFKCNNASLFETEQMCTRMEAMGMCKKKVRQMLI